MMQWPLGVDRVSNPFFIPYIDYVGFIKKIMKQMQKGFNEVQALEIELRILETTSAPPSRPRTYLVVVVMIASESNP